MAEDVAQEEYGEDYDDFFLGMDVRTDISHEQDIAWTAPWPKECKTIYGIVVRLHRSANTSIFYCLAVEL